MIQTRDGSRLRSREGRGFTLIELMVVVGIIGLLIAILIPSLGGARRAAKSATCGANLRTLGHALQMYSNENNGWYPRALPLAPGAPPETEWTTPWPSSLCPMCWQAGYPAFLVPYIGIKVSNPYATMSLPAQIPETTIKYFRCPLNDIPVTDHDRRKCRFPLDFGMYNRASQNRVVDLKVDKDFLMADMTWAMSYVDGAGQGPNPEPELKGWWVPFLHGKDRANVLTPDYGVDTMEKSVFIQHYSTATPPVDDPL